jgi:hypothetical protein
MEIINNTAALTRPLPSRGQAQEPVQRMYRRSIIAARLRHLSLKPARDLVTPSNMRCGRDIGAASTPIKEQTTICDFAS